MKSETKRYFLLSAICLPLLLFFGASQLSVGNEEIDRSPLYIAFIAINASVFLVSAIANYPVLLLTKCPNCEKRYFHF